MLITRNAIPLTSFCTMPLTRTLSTTAISLAFLCSGMLISASAAAESPFSLAAYKLNPGDGDNAWTITKPADAPAPDPVKANPSSAALAGKPYAKLIENAAREASLDPALVHAVISVESAYNATARSPKGAIGLMQIMPDTALRYGVSDPARTLEGNLKAGTLYLRDLMRLFKGRIELVLAAYNAGENAVIRHGERIPPYAETQAYVPAVLAKYKEWREPLPPVEEPKPAAPAEPVRIQYMPGTTLNLNALRAEGYR